MDFVEFMEKNGHQELAVWTDPEAGLKAFIAIHDTTLGPALGGTRIWPHATTEDAILDVLRLSRAMTYKSAAAGLPLGGGKGVVVADPRTDKTEAMFRSYGRFVESLHGRYVTTEDVGATAQEMEWISYETKHVVGLPEALGGGGNPAVMTGFGVFQGMRAAALAVWGDESLKGKTVAMQGFGNVAGSLANHLLEEGARLVVTDVSDAARARAEALEGVTFVEPDAIFDAECDIFSPCALGASLNAGTIPRIQAAIVCGAANNQLREDADAKRLQDRGILWAPDFIVNAGGVINVYFEMGGAYSAEAAYAKTAQIHETLSRVIETSRAQGVTTAQAADAVAEGALRTGARHR
jgi:leucine dehydrogenase